MRRSSDGLSHRLRSQKMTPRILLVDDDPAFLRLLSIHLRCHHYEVAVAQSGEAALANLPGIRPHMVITDLRMEGMDGLTLFRHLRAQHPTLPVVILTAYGTIPQAVEATKEGLFGFLTKPIDVAVLLEQVQNALRLADTRIERSSKDDGAWREPIITSSPLMEAVLQRARLVAPTDASVLIHGESGTGKELLSRVIHHHSQRAKHPFVAVNCGAIPENLLESEFFGHEKGAFTGASARREGLIKAAQGGTLFLDEIGDMPHTLQVKLLRVLQEQHIRPVGTTKLIPVNVRIVSATHRNLKAEIAAGRFREDLYFRLNVFTLTLPSLAERREDIPILAWHFLNQLAQKYGKKITAFAPGAIARLLHASWPGNVRQLFNVLEQAVILSTTAILPEELVAQVIGDNTRGLRALADARWDFERDYLARLLQITRGNVNQAARLARRNRTAFYKVLHRHDLNPSMFMRDEYAAANDLPMQVPIEAAGSGCESRRSAIPPEAGSKEVG